MRLEAKDRQYPTLVCVATIAAVRGNRLLVHFDGWQNNYDYLCSPESTDIHPVGWCRRKGRDLQKPNGVCLLLSSSLSLSLTFSLYYNIYLVWDQSFCPLLVRSLPGGYNEGTSECVL